MLYMDMKISKETFVQRLFISQGSASTSDHTEIHLIEKNMFLFYLYVEYVYLSVQNE